MVIQVHANAGTEITLLVYTVVDAAATPAALAASVVTQNYPVRTRYDILCPGTHCEVILS